MEGKTRAFIEVEPPLEVRERIRAAQPRMQGLKPIPLEQLHMTMAFLGNLTDTEMERARRALAHLDAKAFDVGLKGVGLLSARNHGILFVKAETGARELSGLHALIREALAPAQLVLENREFLSHLTIARVKDMRLCGSALESYISKNVNTDFGSFSCSSVKLEASQLTPEGPIYTDIEEIRLP